MPTPPTTPPGTAASTTTRELSYADVETVLRLAEQEAPGLTLIGGQALNFWAERYLHRSPALQALMRVRPFTSGDLDFIGPLAPRPREAARDTVDVSGELAVAEKIAQNLPGRLEKTGFYGPRATLATISYRDEHDAPDAPARVIHFLGDMIGVDPAEVARTATPIRGHLRVMNGVLCMQSRIMNVLKSASYQNDKGRHQARVSIPCAHEFVREVLDQGHVDLALEYNERIFTFAKERATGCAKEGFRPADALVIDPRLPENFHKIRYPRMQQDLEQLERGRGRGRSGRGR